MARFPAGITGNYTGKLAGAVYGAARTELGKVTTGREYVIPNDPKTADQLTQRSKFGAAGTQATLWGADNYRRSWNNVSGLLFGYAALVRYITENIETAGTSWGWVAAPAIKVLGPVYNGVPAGAVATASGQIKITWDTTIIGDYCAATDIVHVVICAEDNTLSQLPDRFLQDSTAATRSAGLYECPAQLTPSDPYLVFAWLENFTDGIWRSSTMQPLRILAKA